jgi:quercetin dioxygenase-like cupin family protein
MNGSFSYPRTIENGAGETLIFLGVESTPEGERINITGSARPGAGPPMHVHYLQDEIVRVETGRVGYQVLGQEAKFAEPGETVAWPAGTAHKWWNAGNTEARLAGWCIPPGNVEYYLTSIFDSMRQHDGMRPGLFDAAFLTTRYKSEFAMVEIPKPVQAIVIPLLYALGSLLGKHRKFKDAPEPVRSGNLD